VKRACLPAPPEFPAALFAKLCRVPVMFGGREPEIQTNISIEAFEKFELVQL
jgi:hypothetical protein